MTAVMPSSEIQPGDEIQVHTRWLRVAAVLRYPDQTLVRFATVPTQDDIVRAYAPRRMVEVFRG